MTHQPLTIEERGRVYEIQLRLGAIKQCERCERWLPVCLFDSYGRRWCEPCCRELAFDHARGGSLARWRTE